MAFGRWSMISEMLHEAIWNRDLDTFNELISNADDLDKCFNNLEYTTCLQYVSSLKGYEYFVKALLNVGAEPNKANPKIKNKSPIHFAAENGCTASLNLLLESENIMVDALDSEGNTALHLAAQNQQKNCVEELINIRECSLVNKANWKGRTAVYLAAKESNTEDVDVLQILLNYAGINIDSPKSCDGRTARQILAEKLPHLISNFPKPSTQFDFNESVSIKEMFDCLQTKRAATFIKMFDSFRYYRDFRDILFRANQDNTEDPIFCQQYTFLQFACREGLHSVAKILLESGADPNLSLLDDTPAFYIACCNGYYKILELFIYHKQSDFMKCNNIPLEKVLFDFNCTRNNISKNPLLTVLYHFGTNIRELDVSYRKCFEMLTKGNLNSFVINYIFKNSFVIRSLVINSFDINSFDINSVDKFEYSSLFYAAENPDCYYLQRLIELGAYIGERINSIPTLSYMNAEALERSLDSCLEGNLEKLKTEEFQFTINYKFLVPPKLISAAESKLKDEQNLNLKDYSFPKKRDNVNHLEAFRFSYKDGNEHYEECSPLKFISESKKLRHLLKHPVLSSFLHLKWTRIQIFFYTNLIFYILFVISLTTFILWGHESFSDELNPLDKLNTSINFETEKTDDSNQRRHWLNLNCFFLIVFLIILIIRESFQFIMSPVKYFLSFENYIELLLIGFTTAEVFCYFLCPNSNARKHISAIAILLSWTELLLLVGRHPRLSINIEILKIVSVNLFTFLLWFCILITAFALSFYALFNNHSLDGDENFFFNPFLSIFKTLIMMTGEFDASDLPFASAPVTSHIIFLLFVLIMVIISFNILLGLVISDTQKIKADAEIISYCARVNFVTNVEYLLKMKSIPFISSVFKRITLFGNGVPKPYFHVFPNKNKAKTTITKSLESEPLYYRYSRIYNCHLDPNIIEEAIKILSTKSQEMR